MVDPETRRGVLLFADTDSNRIVTAATSSKCWAMEPSGCLTCSVVRCSLTSIAWRRSAIPTWRRKLCCLSSASQSLPPRAPTAYSIFCTPSVSGNCRHRFHVRYIALRPFGLMFRRSRFWSWIRSPAIVTEDLRCFSPSRQTVWCHHNPFQITIEISLLQTLSSQFIIFYLRIWVKETYSAISKQCTITIWSFLTIELCVVFVVLRCDAVWTLRY